MFKGSRAFDPSLSEKLPGVKGLKNLGNTCFVNSVLQNINNLPPVRDYFLSMPEKSGTRQEEKGGGKDLKEGDQEEDGRANAAMLDQLHVASNVESAQDPTTGAGAGAAEAGNTSKMELNSAPLTHELRNFIRSMWTTSDHVLIPSGVFGMLCKQVPRFSHRRQQDAVEALRYIIDGLDKEAMLNEKEKKEEKKRHVAEEDAATDRVKNDSSDLCPEGNMGAEGECNGTTEGQETLRQPSGPEVAQSGIVAEVFSGMLCSRITCTNCNDSVDVLERFSDLSLPIPQHLLQKRKTRRAGGAVTPRSIGKQRRAAARAEREARMGVATPDTMSAVEAAGQNALSENATGSSDRQPPSPPTTPPRANAGDEAQYAVDSEGGMGSPSVSGIDTCLRHFSKEEILSERECEKCSSRCDATRQYMVSKAPEVLVIHIKRFAQTARGLTKLSTFVSYPEALDLSLYSTPELALEESMTRNGLLYLLCGVVVHGGTLHGGHYSAFVRRFGDAEGNEGSQWVYMSDSRVRVATSDEAMLRQGAYILFYCRADCTITPTSSISKLPIPTNIVKASSVGADTKEEKEGETEGMTKPEPEYLPPSSPSTAGSPPQLSIPTAIGSKVHPNLHGETQTPGEFLRLLKSKKKKKKTKAKKCEGDEGTA
eukprot:g5352.t1